VHRSIVVIDVEKFYDPARTNADQMVVRDGMYRALEGALANAGISLSSCDTEDRGDGALVLISRGAQELAGDQAADPAGGGAGRSQRELLSERTDKAADGAACRRDPP
jgi:hypothetical protein